MGPMHVLLNEQNDGPRVVKRLHHSCLVQYTKLITAVIRSSQCKTGTLHKSMNKWIKRFYNLLVSIQQPFVVLNKTILKGSLSYHRDIE